MKIKASILLICAVALSACGHIQRSNQGSPEPVAQESITLEPQIDEETLEQPVLTDPEPTELPGKPLAGLATTEVQLESDLVARITRGFRLPAFESEHVDQYQKWSSEHPTYLQNLLTRAEPFLYYIVEQLELRKLPLELALLPAIESAYKPDAVSRSGAAGLWQFIPATGRHYGLRQDWWYDGRRDVIASTNAALDYLTELNNLFDGDWFLTLAAYNAGQGTVIRAIKANKRQKKGHGYLDLKLRSETRRYVPKLIALKNIISNPVKYGVSLPKIADQARFEILNVGRQVDLRQFSLQSGVDQKQLHNLNAGFIRWASSPEGPHRLLIPISQLAQAHLAMEVISTTPALSYQNHTIRRGETLSDIGAQYDVSVAALKKTNKLPGTQIIAGQSLLVPISTALASQAKPVVGESATANNKLVHRVKRGDTLWSIARHYRVKVQQLISWNSISADQILSLDQMLLVFTN